MKSLCDLSNDVLNGIISFLSQDDLTNLALTNFRFYEPTSKKLYSKICIQTFPPLKAKQGTRKIDFLESTRTSLHGFRRITNKVNHYRLIEARIESLVESLSINPNLINYISEITVLGSFNKHVHDSIKKLLRLFEGKKLKSASILDKKLRRELRSALDLIITEHQIIDDIDQLKRDTEIIDIFMSFDTQDSEVILQAPINYIRKISDAKSLVITRHGRVYANVLEALTSTDISFKFSTFRFTYSHGDDISTVEKLIKQMDANSLRNMEVISSCNVSSCREDCLIDFYNLLSVFKNVRKISIIQGCVYETHKANEFFDLNLVHFVRGFEKLKYLSLSHNTPKNGTFADGFEGNYLRRFKIYSHILPSELPKSIKTLILPNLMSSFACYEQQMNTVIYNGCKCPHCVYYLNLVDELLFTHKFYNNKLNIFKDLVGNQIMHTISEYLSQRIIQHDALTNMHLLSYPLQSVYWNFHDNASSIPYRCLLQEVISEGEYDDGEDLFFDCEDVPNYCKFDESLDFSNYGTVIAHFLDNLIEILTDLDRGDAEGVQIGEELNDGMDAVAFNKILVSGIDYNIDKELNGTNFFSKVHDP